MNGIFYSILSGFAAGVCFRSFFDFGISFCAFLAMTAVAVFAGVKVASPAPFFGRQKTGRGYFIISIFLISASLGILRADFYDSGGRSAGLENYFNQNVSIEAVVSDEPDQRETNVHLAVGADKIFIGGKAQEISGKVLVITDLYPERKYGDRIKIFGLLQKPGIIADSSGREFDYAAYLSKDQICCQFLSPKIEFVSAGGGNFIKRNLFALKNSFMENLKKIIPEPHLSLLGGLILGARQSLGKNLLDDFRKAGVIHIVVLSGYNITIVADSILKIFAFLPRFFGLGLGALGIILFAIMTGGSATVLRASIMALIVILAKTTGRTYGMTRALLLAGFLMLLQNPKILVFDSSFQLSFASTIGLIYFSPIVEKWLGFITEKWNLRSIATATVATQLFVLPLILYKMGTLSLVALPVNMLILSFIPATMFLGFVVGSLAMIFLPLSIPFAYAAYFLLAYELGVVEIAANLPFAAVSIPIFPFWLLALWYAAYGFLAVKFFRGEKI